MSNERYSPDLVVTKHDFMESGWKEILASASREGYSGMHSTFATEAAKAIGEGKQAKGKVLWLLADACSMMLTPDSLNQPFRPLMVMADRRSIMPDDLSEQDLAFFEQIVDDIDNPRLKARLAELLWLRRNPKNIRFAIAAIDAYRQLPLDVNTCVRDGRKCWKRALRLVLMLGKGAENRLPEMISVIVGAFQAATVHDGFLAVWLSDLLSDNGLEKNRANAIADHLAAIGRNCSQASDSYRARHYYEAATKWFLRVKDDKKAAEMMVATAETWVQEATARLSSDDPSNMVAAIFYERAIQTYRQIPRSERESHQVDKRLIELHRLYKEAGEKSLDEMKTIESEPIDLTQMVDQSRKAVEGKAPLDALLAFANLVSIPKVDDLRNRVMQRAQSSPLTHLVSSAVLGSDGRTVARKPGLTLDGAAEDADEIRVFAEMVREYNIMITIRVQGSILPALAVLLLEHQFLQADLVALAQQSPIVPADRAGLVGRALFAGLDYDFPTAIHLLAPQIEHIVRVRLKIAGAKTTMLDQSGVENENGLSTLVELPEFEKIFGTDFAFGLRALFCEATGPNLRNAVAHGLLGDSESNSFSAIYAWWLGFKMVFNTYWHARTMNPVDGTGSAT